MRNDDTEYFPVHIITDRDIEAAIWEVPSLAGPVFSVRVSRLYCVAWSLKRSNLFSPDELLRVSTITQDAYSWIANHRNDARQGRFFFGN